MQQIKLYITSLYLSLFSKGHYYKLFVNYNFYGFRYIALLSLLIAIPITNFTKKDLKAFIGEEASSSIEESNENYDHILSQMKTLRIKEGKFIDDFNSVPQNIFSKSGKLIMVFDPSNTIQNLDKYQDVIFLKSDTVYYLTDGNSVGISLVNLIPELKSYLNQVEGGVTNFNVEKLFSDLRWMFVSPSLILFIGCFCWFFLRYSFKAVAFSFFVGMMVNLIMKGRVFPFKTYIRISTFALTFVFLLEFLSVTLGIQIFSSPELIYFLAHLIYIYYAVDSYKQISFK